MYIKKKLYWGINGVNNANLNMVTNLSLISVVIVNPVFFNNADGWMFAKSIDGL